MQTYMIIFGTTTLNLKRDAGEFYCPVCRSQTSYRKRLARQFFTLYFIPIIPLNSLGEFIQCDKCRQQFDLDILNFDAEAEKREMMDVYIRMMMLTMLTTGCVERAHLEILQDAVHHRFAEQISEDDLMELAEEAEKVDAKLIPYATRIGRSCDPTVCFDLVRVATQILTADGPLSETHRELLLQLGESMQLEPNMLKLLWEPDPANESANEGQAPT